MAGKRVKVTAENDTGRNLNFQDTMTGAGMTHHRVRSEDRARPLPQLSHADRQRREDARLEPGPIGRQQPRLGYSLCSRPG